MSDGIRWNQTFAMLADEIYPIFHVSLITPYYENETHGPNFIKPPPDLIDNEEEFEIETIVSH